jgi:GH25 family lysozyme M1 (1,4-beta-N-acetylmuramidase)
MKLVTTTGGHLVPVNGIDVSHWNGDPDLDVLAEQDWLRLYGMKASHIGGSNMVDGVDPFHARNRALAADIGSVRWRMHYPFIHGSASPVAQIEALRRAVGDLEPGDGIYLDWETPTPPQVVASRSLFEDACALVDAEYPSRWAVYVNDVSAEMTDWMSAPTAPIWHPNFSAAGLTEARRWQSAVWQAGVASVPGFPNPVDVNYVLQPAVLDRVCGLI